MRTIKESSRFTGDFKRERAGRYKQTLVKQFSDVIMALANDVPLAPSFHDHALTGDWLGYRDCHIKPDLLLIYQKTENELLLVRLGSHSQLKF